MAHRRTEEVRDRCFLPNAKNMLLANEALWQGSVDEAGRVAMSAKSRIGHRAIATVERDAADG